MDLCPDRGAGKAWLIPDQSWSRRLQQHSTPQATGLDEGQGELDMGGPGLTQEQMKAYACSGPEGQIHSPQHQNLGPLCQVLVTNHTTHMLSTPHPPRPTRPWPHTAPQENRPRGDRQLGLSLVLGFQDGVLPLPLETRKLKMNAHPRFRVGASNALWEGMRVPGS